MTPRTHHHDIPALKDRLLIPEVWQRLRLEGQPAAKCRSPFREDKNPSFSITKDGRRWKDYGTGQGGDVIDFIASAPAARALLGRSAAQLASSAARASI